jgi:hypothetical protein
MKAISVFLILFSFNLFADEYKAPTIKLGLHPHSEPTIKGDLDWANDKYKFQDVQEKERALASESDEDESSYMLGRNPSSKKIQKGIHSKIKFWKWDKR